MQRTRAAPRAHAASSETPAIISPMRCRSAPARATVPTMRPAFITDDSVRERQDLVQLDRDQQDGAALRLQLHQLGVDELDGADVDAARRLADQQDARAGVDLARQHDLLLVAAGEAARAQPRVGRADVEAPHQPGGERIAWRPGWRTGRGRRAPRGDSPAPRSRRPRRAAPARAAAGPRAHARRRAPRISAGEPGLERSIRRSPISIAPACTGAMPLSTSSSSDWPLPETPATPRISPARSSSETSTSRAAPTASRQPSAAARSGHGARLGRPPLGLELDGAADHQLGQRLARRLGRSPDGRPSVPGASPRRCR